MRTDNKNSSHAEPSNFVSSVGAPKKQGLYDPKNEKDACGVGFVANMKGEKTHSIIKDGLQILQNIEHRGAVGADPLMGDGAGLLVQIPHEFYKKVHSTRRYWIRR